MGYRKNLVATIGVLTVFAGVVLVAWQYRAPLTTAYRAFRGDIPPGGLVEQPPGRPNEVALVSARRKQIAIARERGPSHVTLSSSEMASLIAYSLDPVTRSALDSLTVEFEPNRFVLNAQLVTDVWGRNALGWFSGLLLPREPLRVAGPARVTRPGVIAWRPTELSIRGFPFPAAAIRPIVNSLTGGREGTFQLSAPSTIGAVEIAPVGVTFHRRDR